MNTRFWSFKRIALLVMVPLLATLSLAFWMGGPPRAALADVRQGEGTLAENGVLQEPITPTVQIHTPVNEAIITQREGTTITISGFAWNYTPQPVPGVPTLDTINNFEGGGNYYVKWSAAYSATNYVLREGYHCSSFRWATSRSSVSDSIARCAFSMMVPPGVS